MLQSKDKDTFLLVQSAFSLPLYSVMSELCSSHARDTVAIISFGEKFKMLLG